MDQNILKMRKLPSKAGRKIQARHAAFFVGKWILSAEGGGAKILHQVTEPTPWTGGLKLFRTPEEDATEDARIAIKFQGWSKRGQVGEERQDKCKPWEDQELRIKEEALPSLELKHLRRVVVADEVSMGNWSGLLPSHDVFGSHWWSGDDRKVDSQCQYHSTSMSVLFSCPLFPKVSPAGYW